MSKKTSNIEPQPEAQPKASPNTKPSYKVHPAIGVARLGNSPTEFYISPETTGGVPIDCDASGNPKLDKNGKEIPVSNYKDKSGNIKRQAARFRIYVYDDQNPKGRELKIGDTIVGKATKGKLIDIQWTVYLANKKAVWYQFKQLDGEHGYAPGHPLRNAGITNEKLRQQLIIDPGPQTVAGQKNHGPQSASFSRSGNPNYATVFPPPLQPNSIDSLGDLIATETKDKNLRLLVLGGFGNSGSMNSGFGEPHVETYANNDGWFDDTSDGPVTATLIYLGEADNRTRTVEVDDPGWAIVGYPRYAPELVDMVTMDDLCYDLFVRQFGYNPYLYGPGHFAGAKPLDFSYDPHNPADKVAKEQALKDWRNAKKQYNPDYYPYFYRDIWPILQRPYYMQYVTNLLGISHQAHEIKQYEGDFYEPWMATAPDKNKPDDQTGKPPYDPYKNRRMYVYSMLRLPGEENQLYNHHVPEGTMMYNRELMPLLNGDNPLSNELPAKFMRLTDTQLFMLKQWAMGKFINEKEEDIVEEVDTAESLDRGVLGNVLGGAFCPGAETAWIMRNPAIFSKPYRINVNYDYIRNYFDPYGSPTGFINMPDLTQIAAFTAGLEPGDLTKYGAQPWQTDFNECTNNVTDITYELWNKLYTDTPENQTLKDMQQDVFVLWWPVHRPLEVYQQIANPPDPKNNNQVTYNYPQVEWSRGVPQTHAGDLKMVTEWSKLGFVIRNLKDKTPNAQPFIESEYSGDAS
ncbi:MAG: LodA/GoxA family CTQ-dependent oxidase [Saprospiraceae bacterium]